MTLTENVLRFADALRRDYGLHVGHAEAHDALRALDVAGLHDGARFRTAFRLVFCGTKDDIPIFERAFDAFFFGRPGLAQSDYLPRDSRERRVEDRGEEGAERPPRTVAGEQDEDADSWETLLAKYSAAESDGAPPEIPEHGLTAMLAAANKLIASARLGRSRRWHPLPHGTRFDLRRTLRASLHTGGDPVSLRRLGHPRRNPRFALLIDGSRSMTGHGALALQFAYALCRRTQRADAFVFSTGLRRITRELRRIDRSGSRRLDGLGTAWGGGTRIGASLVRFVGAHAARLSPDDTVTIVFSDGLDTGEPVRLVQAMRQIRRRSAVVIWINPHAASSQYRPATRGMLAALPYLDALVAANDARAFGDLLRS